MFDSDSEYDETGVSNPSFDDKSTKKSTSSDSITPRQRRLKSKKSSDSVEETSFTIKSDEIISSSSSTKAEKPYESEVKQRKNKTKKTSRRLKPLSEPQITTDESVLSVWSKSEEKLIPISEISEKGKTESEDSIENSMKTKSKKSSSQDSSDSIETSFIKRNSKFEKMKNKLLKGIDLNSSSIDTTESIISTRKLNEEKSESGIELSSGEVFFNENKREKRHKKMNLKNISEETITEHESSEITIKPKHRRKKKKEIQHEITQSLTTTDISSEDDNSILAILIHRIDGLKMHYFITHPLVKIHLFDLNSGTYVAKRKNSKSITSYYENESSQTSYIMPIMTQPYEIKGKLNMTPEWQELLIFNEKLNYFTQPDPNVLIVFEILDFISMTQATKRYKKMGKDGGWHRVAWAFLKLVGANNKPNVERKLRLQLYYPLDTKWSFPCRTKATKNIFGWWNNNSKKKYPYTLYVTVKGIDVPQVQPGLRSMIPTQEEKGKTTVDDLQRILEGKSPCLTREKSVTNDIEMDTVRWNRLPGQLCKIPLQLATKINVGRSASCFVVKFSNNGRFLACGVMENYTTHSVILYEVPSWEFRSKCCSHFGIVYDLSWNSADSQIISSSADCTARLWQVNKGKLNECKILPHPSHVYSAKFHPRTPRIAVTACYDHIVRVWDCVKDEAELMQELSQHVKFVNGICFDENGDILFSGDGEGIVCVWNAYVTSQPNKPAVIRDWSLKQTIKSQDLHCKVINDITLHPGGRRVLISTRDNCIRLFDSRDFTLIQKYDGHRNVRDFVHSTITPCGSLIFSGSEDGCIYVWNTNSETVIHTYSALPFEKTINSVHYHPHEHMFAACSYEENMPVLIYIHVKDTQSITLPLHDINPQQTPITKNGILKSSSTQLTSTCSEISSVATTSLTEEDESDKMMPKPSTSCTISSSIKSSSMRSKMVTFQDEVEPNVSKWLKVLDKLNEIVESSSKTSTLSTNETSESSTHFITYKAVSLYSYKARNEKELNLRPGDVICVTRELNTNWSEGNLVNGLRGIFPTNYVYRIDECGNSDTINTSSSSDTTKRKWRKTHAIASTSGQPIFLSASEDETIDS